MKLKSFVVHLHSGVEVLAGPKEIGGDEIVKSVEVKQEADPQTGKSKKKKKKKKSKDSFVTSKSSVHLLLK